MTRTVIFVNGILSQPKLLQEQLDPADRIICADGGTRHALTLGLIPHIIVGDFDSLPPEIVVRMENAGVSIHRHPVDKDKTDLELALELAVAENPQEILLVAALGGRLDQMLANILLLTRPEYATVRLTLADSLQWAVLLRSGESITITGQPGDTLSLLPLSATVQGVDISGVKWPLAQATLSLGSTFTISNTLIGQQATVQIASGLLLLIHTDKNYESL